MGLTFNPPLARGAGPPYPWTGPTDADPHLGQDNLPTAVQASNGTIWLAWQTFRYTATRPDIILKSITNGTVPGFDVRMTSSGVNTSPALVQLNNGNDTIMLFWSQQQAASFNIYYKNFKYNPLTGMYEWSKYTIKLTNTAFDDTSATATVAKDGTLWLFWQRSNQTCTSTCVQTKEIYYKTLSSGSWSSETKITGSVSDTNWNWLPTATITKDGRLWLAWSKGGQSSGSTLTSSIIYYKTYNGTTWSSETQATFPALGVNGDQHASILQDRNGTIWLFWARTSLTVPMFIIYSKFDINNGQTLSSATETQMTNEASGIDSQQPWAVQGNTALDKTIHLFYSSDRTNNDYDIWSLTSPSISPVHDVGIISASPSINVMYAGGLPGKQTSNITISVTVVNYGDFPETVQTTVTVSNKTSIPLISQTQIINIAGSVTLYTQWNTTNAKPARYNLSVTAFSTSTETSGNLGDNSVSVKKAIWLLPWGDVDQDGSVTISDVGVFFFDYGFGPAATPCGVNHCKYFYFEDINNEGVVDIIDVGISVRNYGLYT